MQVSRVLVLVIVALVITSGCLGASLPSKCPDKCSCDYNDRAALRLHCTSLHFLGKIQPKQILAIDALDLSHLGLQHIDPKLSKLRNLKELNLSHNALSHLVFFPHLPKLTTLSLSANHLKQFSTDNLPETLEYLDISKNYISDLPRDLYKLSYLRQLQLDDNPVRCNCGSLIVRDRLFKACVTLSKPVICQLPEKLAGRSFFDVTCVEENPIDYWDQMLGDDPFVDEGSGDRTIEGTTASNDNNVESLGEQFLPSVNDSKISPSVNQDSEGSGYGDYSTTTTEAPSDDYDYESSGFGVEDTDVEPTVATPPPHDSACIFDCSTEGPTTTTTIDPFNVTQPGIIDGIKIILTDLSGRNETDKKEIVAIEATIIPIVISKEEAEPDKSDDEGTDKDLVDVFDTNNKETDELSRQRAAAKSEQEPDRATTYIVVAVLIAIMICLVIYSVLKRRKQRSRKPRNDAEYKVPPGRNSQELKDMTKKSIGQAEDLPEKVPLINGQNGKAKDTGNGITEKPIYPLSADTFESPPSPSGDVHLRSNGNDTDRILPEAHRVTIHAKQLTTPKTPLLVNRHRSDDGSIITTPSSEKCPE